MKVVKKLGSDKIEKYMSVFNSGSEGTEIKKNRAKLRTNLFQLKETFTYGKHKHFCGEFRNQTEAQVAYKGRKFAGKLISSETGFSDVSARPHNLPTSS